MPLMVYSEMLEKLYKEKVLDAIDQENLIDAFLDVISVQCSYCNRDIVEIFNDGFETCAKCKDGENLYTFRSKDELMLYGIIAQSEDDAAKKLLSILEDE